VTGRPAALWTTRERGTGGQAAEVDAEDAEDDDPEDDEAPEDPEEEPLPLDEAAAAARSLVSACLPDEPGAESEDSLALVLPAPSFAEALAAARESVL
jgi:hypothetical protein